MRKQKSVYFVQTLWQRQLLMVSPSSSSLVAMKMSLLMLMLLDIACLCHGIGYSYTRFVGPVTGPEQKISVRNEHTGIGSVDYVGYPKYQFSYGVEDAQQRMLQNRQETRDGDNVHGVYSVVDPNGALRVVKYTADDVNGFQAEVITDGVTSLHGNTHLNENKDNYNHGYRHEAQTTHDGDNNNNDAHNVNNNDDDDEEDDEEAQQHEYEDEYADDDHEETHEGSSEENFEDADEHQAEDTDDSNY